MLRATRIGACKSRCDRTTAYLLHSHPWPQIGQDAQTIVAAVADILAKTVVFSTTKPNQDTVFHVQEISTISIQAYLARIVRYFQCDIECLVVGLVYIHRLLIFQPQFPICHRSIHRLVLTSVVLAVKSSEDDFYSNAHYADVGGLTTKELNMLELEFLRLVDWRLHVPLHIHHTFHQHIFSALADATACMAVRGGISIASTFSGQHCCVQQQQQQQQLQQQSEFGQYSRNHRQKCFNGSKLIQL